MPPSHLSVLLLGLLNHSQQRRTLALHGLQPPHQLALPLLLLGGQCSMRRLQLRQLALCLLEQVLLAANLGLGRLLQANLEAWTSVNTSK